MAAAVVAWQHLRPAKFSPSAHGAQPQATHRPCATGQAHRHRQHAQAHQPRIRHHETAAMYRHETSRTTSHGVSRHTGHSTPAMAWSAPIFETSCFSMISAAAASGSPAQSQGAPPLHRSHVDSLSMQVSPRLSPQGRTTAGTWTLGQPWQHTRGQRLASHRMPFHTSNLRLQNQIGTGSFRLESLIRRTIREQAHPLVCGRRRLPGWLRWASAWTCACCRAATEFHEACARDRPCGYMHRTELFNSETWAPSAQCLHDPKMHKPPQCSL